MNNDDSQRMNMQNPAMRKPMSTKYSEKKPNYSPSTSYNYSPQTGHTGSSPMNPRRRVDNFRRETPNSSDRIFKQNDIIIRLLKEIRDRLPEPVNFDKKESAGVDECADGVEREDHNVATAENADESSEADSKNI
jgi:hypothetical protein